VPPAKPPADLREIGQRIIQAREAKGWTQAELARRTGQQQVTVYRHERGIVRPSFAAALKYAKALGMSLEYLLGQKIAELALALPDAPHAPAPTTKLKGGNTDVPLLVAQLLAANVVPDVTVREIEILSKAARADDSMTRNTLELYLWTRRIQAQLATGAERPTAELAAYQTAVERHAREAGMRLPKPRH
jgi:transcriptional regulator with XRE-family HTH domain